MNDIILNKKDSIERCVKQIRSYYRLPSNIPFEEDYLRQDAIALNLQRACEFRNVLVHEYQRLDIGLMIDVIENKLDDLLLYVDTIVEHYVAKPEP